MGILARARERLLQQIETLSAEWGIQKVKCICQTCSCCGECGMGVITDPKDLMGR